MTDIVIAPTPLPGLDRTRGQVTPGHFFLRDKSGQVIAIEPVDGKKQVTDATDGEMVNAPTCDWRMTKVDNDINLSVKDIGAERLGLVKLNATGSRSGLLRFSGDLTWHLCFVGAAVFSQNVVPNANA